MSAMTEVSRERDVARWELHVSMFFELLRIFFVTHHHRRRCPFSSITRMQTTNSSSIHRTTKVDDNTCDVSLETFTELAVIFFCIFSEANNYQLFCCHVWKRLFASQIYDKHSCYYGLVGYLERYCQRRVSTMENHGCHGPQSRPVAYPTQYKR